MTDTVLFDRDLARLLGLRRSQFHRRKKAGDFRQFECRPQLPHSDTRYSPLLVQRWLDGESIPDPVVGRRSFPKARTDQRPAHLAPSRAQSAPRVDRRLRDQVSR